ncbi:hypothetical protein T439DRAFT_323077 [Meredithblackwellia eburnea MCA 4105]
MITILTTSPPVLTSEELNTLSQSTPSTFNDIPPLLRHQQEAVTVSIDPPFQDYAGGKGTLFVTEDSLSFFDSTAQKGIQIPYPHITLHAISRAPISDSSNGGPCIYCQVDEAEESAEEIEGEEFVSREVICVPEDEATLDKIFSTLSACAALHPPPTSADPSSLFGGLDPSSMVYADADGNVHGPGLDGEEGDDAEEGQGESSAGRSTRERLEAMIQWSPSTNGNSHSEAFEDAEEGGHGEDGSGEGGEGGEGTPTVNGSH